CSQVRSLRRARLKLLTQLLRSASALRVILTRLRLCCSYGRIGGFGLRERGREQYRAVVTDPTLQNDPDPVQELAHDRNQSLFAFLAARNQAGLEQTCSPIVSHRRQRVHVQGGAQTSIALLADPRSLLHARP